MKRMTTLVAMIGFAFIAVPLAALADHHEGKAKEDANSNAQWSDGAKKGQERADEVKNRAAGDAAKAEAGAKAKADDAKATSGDAKAQAKAKADKATADAHGKAHDATAAGVDATGKVDAAVPGMAGAGAEVKAGAAAK